MHLYKQQTTMLACLFALALTFSSPAFAQYFTLGGCTGGNCRLLLYDNSTRDCGCRAFCLRAVPARAGLQLPADDLCVLRRLFPQPFWRLRLPV